MSSTILEPPYSPTLADTRDDAAVRGLTLEVVLWIVLGAVALLMRLIDLGRWPLSESEAALALEAWRFVSGQPYQMVGAPSPEVLSPLAFNLNALLFTLFGASDLTARVAQALGGVGLVLSPWLLRPLLGRGHALAMSLLLLLSPSVLFFSRHASGELWAALFSLLLVAAVARWYRWGEPSDAVLAAVALGVGLASGPGFWSLLAAGGIFYPFWLRRERQKAREVTSEEQNDGGVTVYSVNVDPKDLLPYAPVAIVTFLVAATGLFTNLQGLGAALNLPVEWARALFGAGPALVIPFLFVVWLYEALALLAGFIGGSLLAEKRPGWTAFSFTWAAVTLVPATLTNSGWSSGVLFVTVPLVLVGAATVVYIARAVAEEGSWQVEGFFVLLSLLLFVYFWLNLARYLAAPQPYNVLSLIAPIVILLVAAAFVGQSFGAQAMWRSLGLTLLLWLTIVSVASAWGVSVVRGADPREPLVTQPS
ncbi:MAG: glycosyltransferase family 39 protein, partial [Chloroflexota bacterium]|nr:glycosyltransferase family 39 protein [Chloroflexota bacterium]